MVSKNALLQRTLDKVRKTMSDSKRRLKNRSKLRNLTDLSPVLANATRWPNKARILQRFVKIYDQLREVFETEGTTAMMEKRRGLHGK